MKRPLLVIAVALALIAAVVVLAGEPAGRPTPDVWTPATAGPAVPITLTP